MTTNGNVGRAFHESKRRREDEEYRNKCREIQRKYFADPKNREKRREKQRNFRKVLNEFANKRCKDCGKLLYYRNESGYCHKCVCQHRKRRKK